MRQAVLYLLVIYSGSISPNKEIENDAVERILRSTMNVIHASRYEVWRRDLMRQGRRRNAPYEIGFLTRTAEERYRKMVDLYNSSVTLDITVRTRDTILFLQKIEKLHWDIMHLGNMLHEVERKYKVKPKQLFDQRVWYPFGKTPPNETETTKADRRMMRTSPTLRRSRTSRILRTFRTSWTLRTRRRRPNGRRRIFLT